jgi:hypothetical protein
MKIMKNSLYSIIAVILLAVVITSCYSSRKTGCPGNPTGNFKFKG